MGWCLGCSTACGCSTARRCSSLAVALLTNALHCTLQVISGATYTREVAACKRIAYGLDAVLYLTAQVSRDLIPQILQRPLCLIGQTISAVAHLNLLAALTVLLCMLFGFPYHTVDLVLGETAGGRDSDFLLPTSCLIASCDMENAVSVNVEGHLNLREPARSWCNAFKSEAAKALVVAC